MIEMMAHATWMQMYACMLITIPVPCMQFIFFIQFSSLIDHFDQLQLMRKQQK